MLSRTDGWRSGKGDYSCPRRLPKITRMSQTIQTSSGKKRLTIIVPVYFNEENLPDTAPALLGLTKLLPETEIDVIFVDDGSGDNSFPVLRALQHRWPSSISVIRLSRNFGSMNAV